VPAAASLKKPVMGTTFVPAFFRYSGGYSSVVARTVSVALWRSGGVRL
jgi:hypothetical protein